MVSAMASSQLYRRSRLGFNWPSGLQVNNTASMLTPSAIPTNGNASL
jgi:hypothetical protein